MAEFRPKLSYFAARGVAEISRVLLHLGGVTFEDIRFPFTRTADGIEAADFKVGKEAGKYVSNMDRVPLLEVNGITIGQSKAIERYIATKCHLFGANDEERAVIDNIVENVRDIKDKYAKVRLAASPEKETLMEKWFYGGEFAEWLNKLEKSLPANANGQPFIVGSSATYGDVVVWHFLRDYFSDLVGLAKAIEGGNCHRLTAICDKVADLPAVKHHLSTRANDAF